MFDNLFGDAFGRISPELCRLTYNGRLAIKVANGYRSWNSETGRLTNVTNFTFPVGQDFVFVMPTTKVKVGDVILHGGRPKAVIAVNANPTTIQAINYENGLVETIVPERHVFMGKTYFFGKLVSLFGKNMFAGKGVNGIMKMMMLKEFMGKGADGGLSNLLPLAMLGGNLEDVFNFGDVDAEEFEDAEDEDDEEEVPVVVKPAKKAAPKKAKK